MSTSSAEIFHSVSVKTDTMNFARLVAYTLDLANEIPTNRCSQQPQPLQFQPTNKI